VATRLPNGFVSGNGVLHRLSLAVRLDDHFTGQPVPDTLQVRLRGRPERPVPGPDGCPRRADGTYRFIGLPRGHYELSIQDAAGHWTLFDPALQIDVPPSDPAAAEVQDLWPTPTRPARPGETALRGRLLDSLTGQPLQGHRIEIASPGGPWTRHSITDADGEVLYPFLAVVVPQSDERLHLEVRVDGGARPLSATQVDRAAPTPGPLFAIDPGRETRLRLWVMP